MFKNYIKIAFRNLLKYKKYSFINILGLAIGLACFVLIMLWVQDELSYDRFHKNAENIYIVFRGDNDRLGASTSKMLAPTLKNDLPEVIDATSFSPLPETFRPYLQYEMKGFEENIAVAEPQFFSIFSFPFIAGNPQQAFADPNSIVLTERMSKKFFGNINSVGKSITLTFFGQKQNLKVTGILENLPANSHIQREIFIPIDFVKSYGVDWDTWSSRTPFTYILTQNNISTSDLEQKILACKQSYYKEEKVHYSLLQVPQIHLHANHVRRFASTGDIKYVYIFTIIAAIILLIASVNYMNLSTALSLKRTKEIGIQKVVGALRNNLIRQYFGETLLLTVLAAGLALMLVEFFLPIMNQLAEKSLSVRYFDSQFLITISVTILITTLISGIYPALFMSGVQPIRVLKGKLHASTKGINLRKVLVIGQFSLSIIIIVSTLIVFNQMNYIRDANLGYDKENVVCVKVRSDILGQYETFKNKLLESPEITNVCRSEELDANSLGRTEDIHWQGKIEKFNTYLLHVDSDFASTYKIEMRSGRFYSDEFSTETNNYVLNETAAKMMGIKSTIGTELTIWGRKGAIIGIAKDFNFNSLHHAVEPLVFRIPDPKGQNSFYRELSVRFSANKIHQSMAHIKQTWAAFFPDEPFNFYFVDDRIDNSYRAELRMGDIFKYFSILAIFIACLGLYGLAAFTIEQKFKDIGVHKVLGASISDITIRFSKNYVWWIIISNVIAWPIAWFAMNKWMQNFAYHTNITVRPFLLAGFATLVIALLTVSWQAIRAATANPVEALRYE